MKQILQVVLKVFRKATNFSIKLGDKIYLALISSKQYVSKNSFVFVRDAVKGSKDFDKIVLVSYDETVEEAPANEVVNNEAVVEESNEVVENEVTETENVEEAPVEETAEEVKEETTSEEVSE